MSGHFRAKTRCGSSPITRGRRARNSYAADVSSTVKTLLPKRVSAFSRASEADWV
jgi:hypothetical protein